MGEIPEPATYDPMALSLAPCPLPLSLMLITDALKVILFDKASYMFLKTDNACTYVILDVISYRVITDNSLDLNAHCVLKFNPHIPLQYQIYFSEYTKSLVE